MKKITTKLLKVLLVIVLAFTSLFNSISVQAMETVKNLMDSEGVEKVYSKEFISKEDATNSRLEKITELEELKKLKAKDNISYLYYVSELEKGKLEVPTTEEDFVETIFKYSSEDIIKTTEELESAKQTLIDSYEALEDENNIYDVIIVSEDNNPVKVDTKFETFTYNTYEDAIFAIGNKNLTPVKVYNSNKNANKTVNQPCNDLADCNAKKAELEANNNYISVSVEPIASSSTSTETVTLSDFETKTFVNDVEGATKYAEELKEAISKYIADNTKDTELQKVSITVNLDNILSSNTNTFVNEEVTNISGTYKNEDVAREAATNYINELKKSNSNINVEKTLENITITPNKVDTITVSNLFDSKEAALSHFASLQADETNNYTLENPTVTGIDQTTTSDSSSSSSGGQSTTSDTWGHLDIDATNKIKIMDSDGKTVIDTVTGSVSLSSVVVNGTKTINYSERSYDENRNAWEFMSTNRDSLNVKSGDTVTIKGTITYTYNNKENTLNFTYTGKILTQNNTCEGYPRGYDLSISNINVTTDNKVVVEVATKYKLTYDRYNYTASVKLVENKTTSVVTVPTITKTTTNISYNLVGSYIEKGYDYEVTFPKDVMEDRYSFEAEISHKTKNATKEIDIWNYYVQTMEIVAKGGDEEEIKEDNTKQKVVLEEAPKTGNNINYINLLMISILVIIKKLVK